LSAQETLAHEALAHDASDQEAALVAASAHEAEAQLALDHEAEAQLADDHEAEAQLADDHEAEAHDALAFAALAQLAASKTFPEPPLAETTNWCSAAFGFGGLVTSTAAPRFSSPTPAERGAALGRGLALSMSAPFTWSGVQFGCSARR
jgi:hypothetical protein